MSSTEFKGLTNKQILQILTLSKSARVSENYIQLTMEDIDKILGTRVLSLRLLEYLLSVDLELVAEKHNFVILKRLKEK